MASTIRIKRSTTNGNPSTLAAGELAYSGTGNGAAGNGEDRLYIGLGTETAGNAANHLVIGGKYFTDMMDHVQGTLTANSAVLVDADKKVDNFKVDNLDLDGNTISSTNTNGNITLTPAGTGYVEISGTNGLVIPVGTTSQQGPAVQGAIRYNTSTSSFEGYSGATWGSLGGVKDVDQDTYIIPETSAGNDDDTLTFVTGGTTRAELSTTFDISTNVSTVNINATTGSTSKTTGALVVDGGVGIAENVYIGGNLDVDGTVNYDGGATFQGNLTLTGSDTPATELFTIENGSGVDKFTVDSANGNTVIEGTVDVNGQATFASANVEDLTSGRVVFAGSSGELQDSANLTFDGSTLTISGVSVTNNTDLTGDLDVGGAFSVNTNKFTVASATGNTAVAGTLDVTGNTTLSGTLGVTGATTLSSTLDVTGAVGIDGNFDINTNKFTVASATGNTAIAGTLSVDGATTIGANGSEVAVAVDATTLSLDSTNTTNITMTANDAATKTLAIDATNAGSGAAAISVGSSSTNTVTLNSGTKTSIDSDTEVEINTALVDINSSGGVTVDAGTTVVTTAGTSVTTNSDTVTFQGAAGAGNNAAVAIEGSLDVDNVKIDGNTISTTDGSNTLTIDPAPSGSAGLLIVEGNLQVNGTQTTVNSTTVTIDDPIFVLGGDATPSSDDNLDRGIEFQWYDGEAGTPAAKLGFFGFDDSTREFTFIPDATDTSSVISGTAGNVKFGKGNFVDTTASTSTTTGAVTIAGGVGISGQLNVGGATNKFTATTASSSTTTGAVVVAGGMGVADDIYVGNDIIGAGASTSLIDGFNIDGGTY